MSLITSYEAWLQEYRKDKYKIWVRVILSNNQEFYLKDYNQWFEVKSICESNKLNVNNIGLQYRSHSIEVNTSDADGVYLVRSIIGIMGETPKHSFTIGRVYGSVVKKQIWVTPELIEESSEENNIEDCFAEAIIYHDSKTRTI